MRRLMLLIIFSISSVTTNAAEIKWEVEHPFRYFKQTADVDLHRTALELLTARSADGKSQAEHAPISHIERMLNNPTWWKNNSEILEAYKSQRQEAGLSDEIDLRLGWGSFLSGQAPDNDNRFVDQTCWVYNDNQNTGRRQKHSNCDGLKSHGTARSAGHPRLIHTGNATFRNGTYLTPAFHTVSMRLDKNVSVLDECIWRANTAIFIDPASNGEAEKQEINAPCSVKIRARLPYYSANGSAAAATVSVVQNGVGVATSVMKVRDMLIMAMGDSFSSGEGNPELPATLEPDRPLFGPATPFGVTVPNDRKVGVPRRSASRSWARWTDNRCHRSVYSYQTRVALQLAIAPDKEGNRHHAVTYYHYSCSGAEVTEDLLYAWEGRQCAYPTGKIIKNGSLDPFFQPQISKASSELCSAAGTSADAVKVHRRWLAETGGEALRLAEADHYRKWWSHNAGKHQDFCGLLRESERIKSSPYLKYCPRKFRARPVDLVMLSAGGNDIGFSGVVASAILDNENPVAKLLKGLGFMVTPDDARKRMKVLRHRLRMMDAAMEKHIGNGIGADRQPPVLTLIYPNMIYRQATDSPHDPDRFCEGDNSTGDVSKYLKINQEELLPIERLVEAKCTPGDDSSCGLADIISDEAKKRGWTPVAGHRPIFRDHGICVTRPEHSPDESGRGKAEERGIPYKLIDKDVSGDDPSTLQTPWQVFHPVKDHFPYESRQTGFRTPNQDYLNIQYFKGTMPKRWSRTEEESALFLALRIRGGSFHPTAQAHAHMADFMYCRAREALYGTICDPALVEQYRHPWKE